MKIIWTIETRSRINEIWGDWRSAENETWDSIETPYRRVIRANRLSPNEQYRVASKKV
jgi:hypothetical protein